MLNTYYRCFCSGYFYAEVVQNVMAKAWERQANETSKAYEAFVIYKDIGSGRTFSAVAEKLRKSSSLIRRWKEKYDWENRIAAWDNSISEDTRKRRVDEKIKMLENQIKTGQLMQEKGAQVINKRNFDKVSTHQITEMISTGAELERTARELLTQEQVSQDSTIIFKFER